MDRSYFGINRTHWTCRLPTKENLHRLLEFHEKPNHPGCCEGSWCVKCSNLSPFFSFHSFIHLFYTLYPEGTWMPSKARLKQDPQKGCTWKLGCAAEISPQEVNAKTVDEMKPSSCVDSASTFLRPWCTEGVRTWTSYTLSFADEVAHSPGWPLSLRGVASGPAPRPQRWGESTAPGGQQAGWRKEPFVVPTSTKMLWAPRGIEEWASTKSLWGAEMNL